MGTHSNILAWKISMGREAWRTTIHVVTKSLIGLQNRAPLTRRKVQEGGDIFTYGQFMLINSRNQHNTVKQLSSN